jgi:hypothetical protein
MTIKHIKALDTTDAANGTWNWIGNWSALSVHIVGLEGDVWVEVSNDPAANPVNYGSPPAIPDGCDITGNLAGSSPPHPSEEENINISLSRDGTQAMVSPSALVWEWLRVCKSGGGSVETVAHLMGQVTA